MSIATAVIAGIMIVAGLPLFTRVFQLVQVKGSLSRANRSEREEILRLGTIFLCTILVILASLLVNWLVYRFL